MWFVIGTIIFGSGFILGAELYKALNEHKKEREIKKDAEAEELAARISEKLKNNEGDNNG